MAQIVSVRKKSKLYENESKKSGMRLKEVVRNQSDIMEEVPPSFVTHPPSNRSNLHNKQNNGDDRVNHANPYSETHSLPIAAAISTHTSKPPLLPTRESSDSDPHQYQSKDPEKASPVLLDRRKLNRIKLQFPTPSPVAKSQKMPPDYRRRRRILPSSSRSYHHRTLSSSIAGFPRKQRIPGPIGFSSKTGRFDCGSSETGRSDTGLLCPSPTQQQRSPKLVPKPPSSIPRRYKPRPSFTTSNSNKLYIHLTVLSLILSCHSLFVHAGADPSSDPNSPFIHHLPTASGVRGGDPESFYFTQSSYNTTILENNNGKVYVHSTVKMGIFWPSSVGVAEDDDNFEINYRIIAGNWREITLHCWK